MPYEGVDYTMWGSTKTPQCTFCDRFGTCGYASGPQYNLSEYGSVTGVDKMMAEIYNRGPIACSVYADSDKFHYYTGGVIYDDKKYSGTTHVIAIVGWGE